MMRLFMDGRYLRTDYHDGISRYSYSLIHAVAAMSDPTVIIHTNAQRELLPDNVDAVEFHAPTSAREPLSALTLNPFPPDLVFSPWQPIGSDGRNFGLILSLYSSSYSRVPLLGLTLVHFIPDVLVSPIQTIGSVGRNF